MGKVADYNVISLAKMELQRNLRSEVYKRIMSDAVEEFKKEMEPIVRGATEDLVLRELQGIRDMASMRDELVAYVEWNGDKK